MILALGTRPDVALSSEGDLSPSRGRLSASYRAREDDELGERMVAGSGEADFGAEPIRAFENPSPIPEQVLPGRPGGTARELQELHDRLGLLEARLSEQTRRVTGLETELRTLRERSLLDRMLLRPSGKPKRLVRRVLFRPSGEPRSLVKRSILKRDGSPQRVFRNWMASSEYNALAWPRDQLARRSARKADDAQVYPVERYSASDDARYDTWIRLWETSDHFLPSRTDAPGVSVLIALRGGQRDRLERTVISLSSQSLADWNAVVAPISDPGGAGEETIGIPEACACARVKVLSPSATLGAALASGMANSDRPFVLVLEAGDVLPARALATLSTRMAEEESLDVVYGDEDVLDGGRRCAPQFKPGWSPELLTSYDYIGGPALLRRSAVEAAGSFDPNRDAGARWDLHLRMLRDGFDQVSFLRVARLTEVLCHRWPSRNPSRPDPADAACNRDMREAVSGHWRRLGLEPYTEMWPDGTVRSRWTIDAPPLVSVIIPNKDRADLLRVTLDGLLERTNYPQIEIVVVDNGSIESDTLRLYNQARERGVRIVPFPEPFNYSRACNVGAASANGSLLLFLNNDIEVRDSRWLADLVRYACLPGVGVAGTKLNYPNGVLQHSGVVVGMHVCGLVYHCADEDEWGPFGSPTVTRNWMGVMGACQMVRSDLFDRIGGFDEGYRIAMSDVKLCLDAWHAGSRTVCVPTAALFHHEGASRGKTNPKEDVRRAVADIARLGLMTDPYFHPRLSALHSVPTLRLSMEPSSTESLVSHAKRLRLA